MFTLFLLFYPSRMSDLISRQSVCFNKDWMMAHEESRNKSFKRWPFRTGKCTKKEVAKAGFYSCGSKEEANKARCFCCFVEIGDWKREDIPFEKHLATNAECLFAQCQVEQNELAVKQFIDIISMRNENILKLRESFINEIDKRMIDKIEKLINN